MKFTIAVQMAGLSPQQRHQLHQNLLNNDFRDAITSSRHVNYQLPEGWYVLYGFYKVKEVLKKTQKCAAFLPVAPEILITQSVGRIWSNLPLIVNETMKTVGS